MNEKKVDVSPEDLRIFIDAISKYPAIWKVMNDFAKSPNGSLTQGELSISDKWARKVEKLLVEQGLIKVDPKITSGGFKKYLELTDHGKAIIKFLDL